MPLHQRTAKAEHDGHADAGEQPDERHVGMEDPRGHKDAPAVFVAQLLEAREVLLLAREGLHHTHAGDAFRRRRGHA